MSHFIQCVSLLRSCEGSTHRRPYEAKLVEHREAFPLDGATHAAARADGEGNLVGAHWHIDGTQKELQRTEWKRRNPRVSVKGCCALTQRFLKVKVTSNM